MNKKETLIKIMNIAIDYHQCNDHEASGPGPCDDELCNEISKVWRKLA
jgi:hypothetical protein